jgi:hypothetical protein
MATRLYLPSSGTSPLPNLTPIAAWELQGNVVRLPCYPTKRNTALTTRTLTWPAGTTQDWLWWQFVSPPLATNNTFSSADTKAIVIGKCAETTVSGDTSLAINARVVNNDGGNARNIQSLATVDTEFPLVASAATRIINNTAFTSASITSVAGDRIVIEIGVNGLTPALENVQMRIGDPTATSDFALTSGLTTDLCPWFEISPTVTFAAEGAFEPGTNGLWVPKRELHRVYSFPQGDAHVAAGAPLVTDDNWPPPARLPRRAFRHHVPTLPQPVHPQTVSPSPKPRKWWSAEDLTRTVTTSTDYSAVKVDLTFQPNANSKYFVFWNVLADADTAAKLIKARLRDTTLATGSENIRQNNQVSAANNITALGGLYIFTTAASPPSHNLQIQTATELSNNMGVQEAVIFVLEADPDVDSSVVVGSNTYSSTSYAEHAALTHTQDAQTDLLVLTYAEIQSTVGEIKAKTTVDGVDYNIHDLQYYDTAGDWLPYIGSVRLINHVGTSRIAINVASSVAASDVTIRNAHIVVLDLKAFLNYYTAEDRTSHNSTSATYADSASVTATPEAVNHFIIGVGQTTEGVADGNTATGQRVQNIGTAFAEQRGFPGYWWSWLSIRKRIESNVSTTWKTQYARTAGTQTAVSDEHVLAVLQLDSIDPVDAPRPPIHRWTHNVPVLPQQDLHVSAVAATDDNYGDLARDPRRAHRTGPPILPQPYQHIDAAAPVTDDNYGDLARQPRRGWRLRPPILPQPYPHIDPETDTFNFDWSPKPVPVHSRHHPIFTVPVTAAPDDAAAPVTDNNIPDLPQPPHHLRRFHVPLLPLGDAHVISAPAATDDNLSDIPIRLRDNRHPVFTLPQSVPSSGDTEGDPWNMDWGPKPVPALRPRHNVFTVPVTASPDDAVAPVTDDNSPDLPQLPRSHTRHRVYVLPQPDAHVDAAAITDDNWPSSPFPPPSRWQHGVPLLPQPDAHIALPGEDSITGPSPPRPRWRPRVPVLGWLGDTHVPVVLDPSELQAPWPVFRPRVAGRRIPVKYANQPDIGEPFNVPPPPPPEPTEISEGARGGGAPSWLDDWFKRHEEHEEWHPKETREDERKEQLERREREREDKRQRIEARKAAREAHKRGVEHAKEAEAAWSARQAKAARDRLEEILFLRSIEVIDVRAAAILRADKLAAMGPDEDAMAALMLAAADDEAAIVAACGLMMTTAKLLQS